MAPLRLGTGGVGLDVGTSAVRAAEIRPGRPPTVARFGQVLLPRGAVRNGIVEDAGAVAQAIGALWKRAGFKSRLVRVGLSNDQVVTRQIELPAMPREDVAGAIMFEGQDYIPIPLDDAVVDFEVMEETIGPEGEPLQRVMVVAATRAMVNGLLGAISLAKLQPDAVELNAYPLVRSLAGESAIATDAEAVIDVGAGITDVVVHHGGRIKFARPLPSGGDDFTAQIAEALDLEWDEAENLKLRAAPALARRFGSTDTDLDEDEDPDIAQAAEALVPLINRFAEEIRGSLDYYDAQPDSFPLARARMAGGGSLLPGLSERIRDLTKIDVEMGYSFSAVRVGKVKLEPAQIEAAQPFLAVAVGLALGGLEE